MADARGDPFRTLEWSDGAITIVDQTLLPMRYELLRIDSVAALCESIRELRIRGAPAIGCAAAYGLCIAANQAAGQGVRAVLVAVEAAAAALRVTRPTAVNLFWALDRMLAVARRGWTDAEALAVGLATEATRIQLEDDQACRAIGRHGAELVHDGARVITHCNAGGLATSGYGTAVGVVRAAVESGKLVHVYVDETRPLLQGARLTAWELKQLGIPATLICDSAAAGLLAAGEVDLAVVGADRIAANGDVANKVGTLGLAVLCKHFGVPLYVAAPLSTLDPCAASGKAIPIEERSPDEVTGFGGVRTAPELGGSLTAWNPAFDVTPAELVAAIITEHGVTRPPYGEAIRALCAMEGTPSGAAS